MNVEQLRQLEQAATPRRVCSVDGCDRTDKITHGMCGMHNWRMRAYGSTDDPCGEPKDRIASRVDIDPISGCWVWKLKTTKDGYGVISYKGRDLWAHRFAYETFVGPIPDGLQLDHLCRNPPCCNPDHLEPVTGRENTLRGTGPSAANSRKTHCKRGHEFTPENTLPGGKGGRGRRCRRCTEGRLWERKGVADAEG